MNDPAKKLAAATRLKIEILVANLIDSKELVGLKPILRDDSRAALLVNDAGVGRPPPLLISDVADMSRMIMLSAGGGPNVED